MKVTGENIKNLLGRRLKVFSFATGRMGRVIRVEGNVVYIQLTRGRLGVTTFTGGDPVHFATQENGSVAIVNTIEGT